MTYRTKEKKEKKILGTIEKNIALNSNIFKKIVFFTD